MEKESIRKRDKLIADREAKIDRGEDRHKAWSDYLDDFNRIEIDLASQESVEDAEGSQEEED